MPPSDMGAGAAGTARAGRSGPTRATPVLLLALAGVLLAARVALGIYEHVRLVERVEHAGWREPRAGEAETQLSRTGASRDSTFGAPSRGP